MPVVVPANHAQVVHSLTLVGDPEPIAVTYGVEHPVEAVAQDVVTALHDMFADMIALFVADDYTLTTTEMTLYLGQPAEPFLFIASGNRTGGASSDPLPQNCAFLVHKRSQTPGRRGRGRLYIPGIAEGAVAANGTLTQTQKDATQAAVNTWLGRFGSGTVGNSPGAMVILHNVADPNSPAAEPSVVNALQVDPIIATQRRRLR